MLTDLAILDCNEGACEEAARLSRSMVEIQPLPGAFMRLASATFQQGTSLVAAQEILSRGIRAYPTDNRHFVELGNALGMNILQGHFDLALQQAAQYETVIANDPDESSHEEIAKIAIDIHLELGRREEAGRLADDFDARRRAWNRSDYFDYSIVPLRMKYLAGVITATEYGALREGWLKKQAETPSLVSARGLQWVMSYAQAVTTELDAREALDALPAFLPMVDPLTRDAESDAPIGLTYMLAGKLAEARQYLDRAAHSCHAIDLPFWHTRANLYLGELLEREGDRRGACRAYRVVTERWGKSAESISAAQAQKGEVRLRCSSL